MKLDSGRSTDFVSLPAEEAEKTIEAIKQAEQTNDIEALKWCARRIVWLDDVSEIVCGDDTFHPAHLFNKTWADTLKTDPVPDSIKDIIARIDQETEPEPPDADDAGKALNTLRSFFEENMGGKSYRAVCELLDNLRGALKTAEAGE